MRIIAIMVLIITTYLKGYGQFEEIQWEWNDTSLDRQIRFWPNGSTKIANKVVEGQLLRFQYYENGDLQLIFRIKQYRQIDTVMVYDIETAEGHIERIEKIFGDIPDGDYKVYFPGGKPKIMGTYQEYIPVGTQTEYWENGDIKSITNYNSKGQKFGIYEEYYENGKLKQLGEYYVKEVVRKEKCYDAETFKAFECEKIEEIESKSADWKYYDISGNIIGN